QVVLFKPSKECVTKAPSCVSASECLGLIPVTPISCLSSNCQLLFFSPEHPGENCFQVWVEVKLSGARAPWEPH
uniref:Uncharacterized protein n=1 Tax=Catharus ustulatus TaxID=91951 RepID=A0A8C3UDL4_CATUS